MAATKKVHYFRNMLPNSLRVLDISFGPHGQNDVASVPADLVDNPRFRPAVARGQIQEISKAEYEARFVDDTGSNLNLKPDEVITFIQKDGKAVEIRQPVVLEGPDRSLKTAVRPEIDHSNFVGSEFATGSRPDPGAGRTLSDLAANGPITES